MMLAGDIGGTHTRLVLLDPNRPPDAPARAATFRSKEHPGLVAMIREFLAGEPTPGAAAFGVAGPVFDGRAEPTNLAWAVDAREMSRELGIPRITIRNDLETTGIGIALVPDDKFLVLQAGHAYGAGNAALIAAGTGLGESILVRDAKSMLHAIPSEGGHSDFGPRDAEQDALVAHVRKRFGHCSAERLVSGPGLRNIHEFVAANAPGGEDPAVLARFKEADPSAVIAQSGLAGSSPVCVRALKLFVRCYGQEAASLALKALATGGLFVGGGIAPKILAALRTGEFIEAFRANPVLGELLAKIPVRVVLDDRASLLGASLLALAPA